MQKSALPFQYLNPITSWLGAPPQTMTRAMTLTIMISEILSNANPNSSSPSTLINKLLLIAMRTPNPVIH